MAWDFSTEPEFQEKLDWIREFVKTEIEPIDLAFDHQFVYDKTHPVHAEVLKPLQKRVQEQGLWACHLGSDLGGLGYGQLKLALINEILGRSSWAPSVFGCQAPDSGNAEILAHYGTDSQKEKYLQPLLDGDISSCYSMTEPQAGSDPQEFTCKATKDGDEWVIEGEKWYSSNLRFAAFAIVMAITDADVPIYQGASMFLVPTNTPGVEIIRNVGLGGDRGDEGSHAYVHYNQVRVPAENLLGGEGQAFVIAQTRLGGGRIHHAMRTIAMCQRALDMMCERALSRVTQGEVLAKKQMVQEKIADSWIQLKAFRLMVLQAAWTIDQVGGAQARTEIAAVKVLTPQVLHDIVYRSLHIHGSLGTSNEMPLIGMWAMMPVMGIADGPTEVHKLTVARQVLKGYKPSPGLWPSEHLPERQAEARKKFAALLEHEAAQQ
ncbi:MAG: acyl-CoA dehydrogenase family protein [Actinobacteria bacterium]|jgi:acyl-CoA dehydrogenase|nr:acyl-CoA dehydrogenase family protein [Actinomycetota bacterium]